MRRATLARMIDFEEQRKRPNPAFEGGVWA
jgi:hypothetical protein